MKHMMVIILLTASTLVSAGEGQGQSVMFKNDANKYEHLSISPEKEREQDKCKEMSKKIEALNGKPQRRYALSQRYEAECLK